MCLLGLEKYNIVPFKNKLKHVGKSKEMYVEVHSKNKRQIWFFGIPNVLFCTRRHVQLNGNRSDCTILCNVIL